MVDMNTDQFRQFAQARHDVGEHFTADEVEKMPPTHYKALLGDVARYQRGEPEHVMLKAQQALGSGVYAHTLEHVGDLSHRMTEDGGTFGTQFVEPKVRQQLRGLTHPYGFAKEMHEQVAANQRYNESRGKTGATEEDRRQLGQQYADAHRKVPAYTEPIHEAREAAVAVGEDRFSYAVSHLRSLESMIGEGDEAWKQRMSQGAAVRFMRGEP